MYLRNIVSNFKIDSSLNRFEVIVVMEEVIEENVVEVEVVAIVVEVEVVVIVVGGGVVVKEVTEEVVGFCPVG